jgi:hypothetical protein
MAHEVVLIGGAVFVGLLALALSPVVRAICWCTVMHRKLSCDWEKHGKEVREVKRDSVSSAATVR